MIDRYFACCDCKIYICAGDRWAYWALEDAGVLRKGAPISAKAVLSAEGYWNPRQEGVSDWLYNEIFPAVRLFFQGHESHKVVFGDKDDFLFGDNEENYWNDYFNWMQVGFLPAPSPRFFVEQLGLKTWDEVRDHVAKQDRDIWWMYDEKFSGTARRKFEELIIKERHLTSRSTGRASHFSQQAMKQKITGFEKDEEDHWRAVLECGHRQHVRHDPPLTTRDWVLTPEGRDSRVGFELECKRCEEEQA